MNSKKLLLVEDDRTLADLIGFTFERDGYEVTRTGDGEEALEVADLRHHGRCIQPVQAT